MIIGVCLSVRTVFVRKISQERVHGSPPNLVGGSRGWTSRTSSILVLIRFRMRIQDHFSISVNLDVGHGQRAGLYPCVEGSFALCETFMDPPCTITQSDRVQGPTEIHCFFVVCRPKRIPYPGHEYWFGSVHGINVQLLGIILSHVKCKCWIWYAVGRGSSAVVCSCMLDMIYAWQRQVLYRMLC